MNDARILQQTSFTFCLLFIYYYFCHLFNLYFNFIHKVLLLVLLQTVHFLKSCSVMSDSLRLHGLYSLWNSPDQNTGVGSLSLLQGTFPTQVSHIAVVYLPAKPQGKPKNTTLGSLSFLQGIFPTQELNWGLLRCRWIIYQLSYQGNPMQESYSRLHSHPAFYLFITISVIYFISTFILSIKYCY